MSDYLPFLIVLMVVAALLREDSIFLVFYLIAGIYIFSSLWNRQTLKKITFRREFTPRAFYGENIPVQVVVENPGRLPSSWLLIHDSLPAELITPNFIRQVIHLPAHGKAVIEYNLQARKRGIYPVGPFLLRSGDFFGLTGELARHGDPDSLIVYPRVIPLRITHLPSHALFGTLRHHEPLFEDPARIGGKREYQPGDSLRRLDWKASASSGQLVIKQYQPSIALETCVILDLHESSYPVRNRIQVTELAVTTAASLANWIISRQQAVGLICNGTDPAAEEGIPTVLQPHKGRPQLIQVLEQLARIQIGHREELPEILRRSASSLAWGTTILLVTGRVDDQVFDALFQMRRHGLDVVVLLVGSAQNSSSLRKQASSFNIPLYPLQSERDLESWQMH
ncbi:MAG TPA: DUF58 domain-containing protein [Anaerolineaceae bacterium]|nr:DUF58 domain-containing protein [Anaerolineaceae bacterium]